MTELTTIARSMVIAEGWRKAVAICHQELEGAEYSDEVTDWFWQ
jgi:hypothetical protein